MSTGVGVQVTTSVAPGPSTGALNPAATFFCAGLTERGPVTQPALIRSMSDYANQLGAYVSYGAVWDALNLYFQNGGTQAYVQRVVGSGATTGSSTLQDSGGSPQATLSFTALSPGAWSSQLTYTVAAGQLANTFTITLFLNGSLVEYYPNLTTPAAAVTAMGRSAYVVCANLGSTNTPPANNPAVVASTALSAGNDQRASVTSTTLGNALALFAPALGPGKVAIPGQGADNVGTALIAHAAANNRIAVLSSSQGMSVASATSDVATFLNGTTGQFAGYFYPWLIVPVTGGQGTRTVSPEGAVAGASAATQVATGDPGQAPAGIVYGKINGIVGTEQILNGVDQLSDTVVNNLVEASVNPIRLKAGTTCVYGWQSLSTDTVDYEFLSVRDLLNYISWIGTGLLEPFVFGTVDGQGQFYGRMSMVLTGFLQNLASRGTLFANVVGTNIIDPGYLVDCGVDVNPASQVAAGVVKANVAVRKSGTAELIILNIVAVAIGNAL